MRRRILTAICPDCGSEFEDFSRGHRERCCDCATALARKIAPAHQAVRRAVSAGHLTPLPCEVCGTSESVVAHHDDYSRPLDVRWLCRSHHRQHHAAERRKALADTRGA